MSNFCAACGNSRQWHRENQPRHQFIGPGGELYEEDKEEKLPESIRAMPTPFDPVLRQALLDKEILTVDDLKEAEAKIKFLSQGLGEG